MSKIKRVTCTLRIIVLAVLPTSPAQAATVSSVLADVPLPATASLQSVSEQARHNGLSMAIAALQSTASTSDVAQFYRQQWQLPDTETGASKANGDLQEATPGFIEQVIPGWLLISRIEDNYQIVVQLHREDTNSLASYAAPAFASGGATNSATGFISVVRLNQSVPQIDHGPFSDLKPLSSNQSQHGVDSSTLSVYASPTSLERTHELYIQRLVVEGWRVLADTQVDVGWVSSMVRDEARLELSFLDSSEFGSILVAHEVKSK